MATNNFTVSNNLTVSPNGTDKIGSVNADVVLNTEGQSVTFVFVDSTQVILEPLMVASSKWYRPLIAGAIGLGIGLFLTLLIAIIAVIMSLSSGNKNGEESEEKSA